MVLQTILLALLLPVVAFVVYVVYIVRRLLRLDPIPVHKKGGVLVTGVSSGLGRHAAKSLADMGYTVYGTIRKEEDAKNVPTGVHPLRLDVRFQDSVDLCMDTLKASLKKTGTQLVALVNNAGVGSVAPCEFVDLDEARDVFEVNYFGLIRMCKACIPLLRETGPGTRIVNIGSVSGLVASPGGIVYLGCKFATEALSAGTRMELKPWGIHVSTINPGFMSTEIANKGPDSACPEAQELYPYMGGFMDYMRNKISTGSSPDVTSKAIIHAITSSHPRPNYILAKMDGGMPSWALIWLSHVLPTVSNEAIILSGVQAFDPTKQEAGETIEEKQIDVTS